MNNNLIDLQDNLTILARDLEKLNYLIDEEMQTIETIPAEWKKESPLSKSLDEIYLNDEMKLDYLEKITRDLKEAKKAAEELNND